jgi:uncharacterized SAM-binding protein YcdF (DUF218 family)
MAAAQASPGRFGAGLAAGAVAGLLARDLDLPTLVSYRGPLNLVVVVVALLLAALWPTRLRPLLAAGTVLLAAAWLVIAFTPLTRFLVEGLVRRDAPASGDAVFVLASRIQDDGDLTVEAMSRLLHGLELLGEGRAERLVLSELKTPGARYATTARALMQHLRLPQELITVGPVDSTRDEAVAVARLFRERGWRRLLLVTSPTHSLRAAASFEREGLAVVSSPSMETRFDLENLTRTDDRLFAFGALLHERVGLAVYRRRGWIN